MPHLKQLPTNVKRVYLIGIAGTAMASLAGMLKQRGYEIAGMRQALLAALETDVTIEAAAGPERVEFNRIRKEQGLKAALAWRDARYGELS